MLGCLGSFCKNFDCFDGISAHGAFLRKHQGIGTVEHRVKDIGYFRAGWSWVFDH
jgi:hypothetical protein